MRSVRASKAPLARAEQRSLSGGLRLMAACGLECGVPSGRGSAASGWRMACWDSIGVSAKGQAAGRSAYRSVMDERQAAAEACSVCGVLVIVPWVILAAWRWTRVAVDRTGADPDRACVVIVQRNVRHRAEDPGALDVEDGVPPPRAAPPLLRRVVLNRLPSTDLVSSPGARARAACLHAACS